VDQPVYLRTTHWLIDTFVEGIYGPLSNELAASMFVVLAQRKNIRSIAAFPMPEDGKLPEPRMLDVWGRVKT
jgi:hypothetical protein